MSSARPSVPRSQYFVTDPEKLKTTPHLEILLIRGEGLPPTKDAEGLSPFVEIHANNDDANKVRSGTARKTVDPSYKEKFFLYLPNNSGNVDVNFVVHNWHDNKDDVCGKGKLSLDLSTTPIGVPTSHVVSLAEGGKLHTRIIAHHTKGTDVVDRGVSKKEQVIVDLSEGVKQAKLADSNVAGIHSHDDIQSRVNAAKTEKAWQGAGAKPGIQIWRIEKFNVVAWPKSEYGKFYDGDSYILLYTYKKEGSDSLLYNVHFWLGNDSSQDEKGTAAYKTVELDDLLGDLPVQYRECQGAESSLFTGYFKDPIQILSGGVESGFHHVTAEKYQPRLLHVQGHTVKQVPCTIKSINRLDCFILDSGLEIFVWEGVKSSHEERYSAQVSSAALKSERSSKPKIVKKRDGDGDEDEEFAKFWSTLGGKNKDVPVPTDKDIQDNRKGDKGVNENYKMTVLRLSDATGEMQFEEVATGRFLPFTTLDTNDVFIVDVESQIFVWVGRGASVSERKYAIQYAMFYAEENNRPVDQAISRVVEGCETQQFLAYFSGTKKNTVVKEPKKK